MMMKDHLKKQRFTVGPTLRKMPLTIIPFVLSLFITVQALTFYGITSRIGAYFTALCGTSTTLTTFIYGITSALSANILNNIPMTVAYVPIAAAASPATQLPAILSTAIGSNLGANLTPIGALAGIMWMNILRDKDVSLGFKEFVKYGLLVTPVTLLACLGVLAAEFLLF